MNKKIIFITLILSFFFFFTGNVKATNKDRGAVVLDEYTYGKYFDSIDNASEKIKEQYNQYFDIIDYDPSTEDYVCGTIGTIRNTYINCYKWSKDVVFSYPPQIAFNNWYETGSSSALMYFAAYSDTDFTYTYVGEDPNTGELKPYTKTRKYIGTLTTNPIINGTEIKNRIVQGNSFGTFYYKGSVDLIFGNYIAFNHDYFSTLVINYDDSTQYMIQHGGVILDKEGYSDWNKPKVPEIDIDIYEKGYIGNDKIFEKIRVTYSIFDPTKFTYKFKSSLNNEWDEIYDHDYYYSDGINGFRYDNMINQTLYFLVEDKEGNYITAATYSVSNLKETLPHVTFKDETPDYCKIDNNMYACKGVRGKVYYYNELKYQGFYSTDNATWQDLYIKPEDDYEFYELFTHNTTIYIKFVDRTTNQTVNTFSYNCKGIATEYDISTPDVKYESKYDKETSKVMLTTVIYAYDNSLYTYYFSKDNGQTFQEIEDYEIVNLAKDLKKMIKYFDYDTTVILKMTDKEGNFIKSFPYKIEYTKISEEATKEKNFLTNIVDSVLGKFPIFEQAYTIYNLYLNYNFNETKPNMPKINLSFIGINREYDTFDFTFYDQYRTTVFQYMKLSLAIYTLFKLYKIVRGYFGGGK